MLDAPEAHRARKSLRSARRARRNGGLWGYRRCGIAASEARRRIDLLTH